jgi:drug/metabolite transporter (DMT)-like permease
VHARTGEFHLASATTLASLGVAPELLLSLVATGAAFAIQQVAFSRGRVSLVVPLVGVAGTLVVVVLGSTLLREALGGARAAGIALMLAGSLLVGRGAPRGAHPESALGRGGP